LRYYFCKSVEHYKSPNGLVEDGSGHSQMSSCQSICLSRMRKAKLVDEDR
jgi:hypothetical protein